jgi:hypothetical protein
MTRRKVAMFSNIAPEERAIRGMVDAVLEELSPQFDALYSHTGRSPAQNM